MPCGITMQTYIKVFNYGTFFPIIFRKRDYKAYKNEYQADLYQFVGCKQAKLYVVIIIALIKVQTPYKLFSLRLYSDGDIPR